VDQVFFPEIAGRREPALTSGSPGASRTQADGKRRSARGGSLFPLLFETNEPSRRRDAKLLDFVKTSKLRRCLVAATAIEVETGWLTVGTVTMGYEASHPDRAASPERRISNSRLFDVFYSSGVFDESASGTDASIETVVRALGRGIA
jgi:hypothetical protein